jgi:hypothetical protein
MAAEPPHPLPRNRRVGSQDIPGVATKFERMLRLGRRDANPIHCRARRVPIAPPHVSQIEPFFVPATSTDVDGH